ncbi:NAD(P)H-dependent oxidoreductase [Anaerovibrio lipolyticus]|nr:NAD(P)H-dependent oxidoreductase [Anaerovibrio lipolyticus]
MNDEKLIAINGSPRRNGNTSKILQAETKTLYA